MLIAALVFTATYVVVALGRLPGWRLDRTGAAVVAALMVRSATSRAWLLLAMAATLAGNLTLVGSIANIIVAEGARKAAPVHFREYLKVGVPVTLLTLAAGLLLVR